MLPRRLEPEVMDSAEDASDYDSMDHSEVNSRFVDDLLAALPVAPDSSQPLEILDLGTGTALIPIVLCQRRGDVHVTAVDAALSMLELGAKNIAAASLEHAVRLEHIDVKQLPFPDGRFAAVMSNSIVHHIAEPQVVLHEAIRVTAPGGLLFFRDLLRPPDLATLEHLVATYAAECNEHQRQLFADSLHAALSLDEIRRMVAELGFDGRSVQATSDRHWTWLAQRP